MATNTLKKPTLSAVKAFAEAKPGHAGADHGEGKVRARVSSEIAPKGLKSGLVPDGDVRLTANIRGDVHLALKIRAAQERTTVGELIEQWVEGWK